MSIKREIRDMEKVFSGIKPTGKLTLGNYIGALKNFASFQEDNEVLIFIADLHALTLPIDPQVLRDNTRDICALYLAAGLDPKKSIIFLQSDVSMHAELATILGNYLYLGELSRMTQFKDTSAKMNNKKIGLGILTYPVLMAADILLYNAKKVPVGEDQKQHVEITRDLAIRFNKIYGDILTVPDVVISKTGARIMSLSDPTHKMSKSDPKGDIFLNDEPKVIRKKIMSAVTDSEAKVYYDPVNKPGISNLLQIYASLKDISIPEAEKEFADSNYGNFKSAVSDLVIDVLTKLQNSAKEIIASGKIDQVLEDGAKKARAIAERTLTSVKHAVGLYGN